MDIVLVGKEPLAVRLIARSLTNVVATTTTLSDAVAAVERTRAELILAHWQLGACSSVCALRRLDQLTALVLFNEMTVASDELARALDLGADDVIAPCTNAQEIQARLRALHRRTGPRSVQSLVVGNRLRVELGQHEVFVDGESIPVTRLEFRFIACLARRAGACVPKAQIYAEVFESKYRGRQSNALPTLVSRLRPKLGALGAALIAVAGVGYRLDCVLTTPAESSTSLLSFGPIRL